MRSEHTAAVLLLGALLACSAQPSAQSPLGAPDEPLLVGVGDRISVAQGERWVSVPSQAEAAGLELDLFAVWLTRGWTEEWVDQHELLDLVKRGITPVVVHYYFGDDISRELVERERKAWYTSLWNLSQLVNIDAPVLVVLEPEFNLVAAAGETSLVDWPWFGDDLRAAAEMIKGEAPNALVGACPGDFSPARNLGPLLRRAVPALDFLAFQEMRASTDPAVTREGYLSVGQAAVEYAGYLHGTFELPILLAYLAVSSYGGWEAEQAAAISDLAARSVSLRNAGVFGVMYFQLHDDPAHVGYFGDAEPHFGLLRADGSAKPALRAFRALKAPRHATTR